MVIFAFKSYQLDQKLLKAPFSGLVVFDVITRGVLGINLTVAMLRGHVAPSHLVSSTHGDFYSFTAFAKVPLAQVSLKFHRKCLLRRMLCLRMYSLSLLIFLR